MKKQKSILVFGDPKELQNIMYRIRNILKRNFQRNYCDIYSENWRTKIRFDEVRSAKPTNYLLTSDFHIFATIIRR